MDCHCNLPLEKEYICMQCAKPFTVLLEQHERISTCPQHKHTVAVCGIIFRALCSSCEAEGYCLKIVGRGFLPEYQIIKKSEQN